MANVNLVNPITNQFQKHSEMGPINHPQMVLYVYGFGLPTLHQFVEPFLVPAVPFLSDGRSHRLSLKRNQRRARHGGNHRSSCPRAGGSWFFSLSLSHSIYIYMHMCYISTCAFMFNLQTVGSLSNICALWLQVGKIMMEYGKWPIYRWFTY